MKRIGPFSTKNDMELDYLEVVGPARIRHHLTIQEDVTITGPLNLSGILDVKKDIQINGPVSLNEGTITCKEELVIMGPFRNDGGKIEAEELLINGPLNNLSDFPVKTTKIKVNGPLSSKSSLNIPSTLKINGPVSCRDSITAENIVIRGPINMDGALVATEKIEIILSCKNLSDDSLIECEYIQANKIEISCKTELSPFIEVDLKAPEIVLKNVRHKGAIEGNLTLIDDATHED